MDAVSGVRLSEFRFHPRTVVKWGGLKGGGGSCVRVPASASAFCLSLPDLLAPPPSMSSFHSPQLVMSPAASDVKVSQAEGTMELRENVNPGACACVRVSVGLQCVCMCVSLLTGY